MGVPPTCATIQVYTFSWLLRFLNNLELLSPKSSGKKRHYFFPMMVLVVYVGHGAFSSGGRFIYLRIGLLGEVLSCQIEG